MDNTDKLIDVIQREFGGLKTEVTGLRTDFGGLKDEMVGLRIDFGGLRTDFGGLKDEMAGLKTEITVFRRDMNKHLAGIVRYLLSIEDTLKLHEARISKLERRADQS